MKRYAQQPRYNYTIIWNFLCDDLKKLQQFKTLISFKYVVSKVIHGELIHRYIIYDIHTYIFNENLPKISGMLNPFCTRVRLGYVTDSSQTLQSLVYVWHHPFFCTSVRHHFVCFYSWNLQNCFDDCDGSSQNRYLSCLFERCFQKRKDWKAWQWDIHNDAGNKALKESTFQPLPEGAEVEPCLIYLCLRLWFSAIISPFVICNSQ